MVTVKNSVFVFGGNRNSKSVLKFDFDAQEWTSPVTSSAPFDLVFSGCIKLTGNEVLIVGSESFQSRKSSVIFNFDSNEWSNVGSTNFDRYGSSLVTLGDRIFAIGGGFGSNPTRVIEEFHAENKSWTATGYELVFSRSQHSAVTVPVHLFTHLCY